MCTKSEYVPLEVGCEYVHKNNGHLMDSDFGPAGDLQTQIRKHKHNMHKLGRLSITLLPLLLGRGCEVLRKSDTDDEYQERNEVPEVGGWKPQWQCEAEHTTKPSFVTTLSRGSG